MGALIFAAVELVTLYTVDGRAVLVNPQQVTQLHEARAEGAPNKQLTDKVRCIIRLTDASYVTVTEDCDTVRELLEEAKP